MARLNKITPSEALSCMKGFSDRVDRLQANEYMNKRFRTYDLSTLKLEVRYIIMWHSIALFNKNKERAKEIISKCAEKRLIALDIIDKELN